MEALSLLKIHWPRLSGSNFTRAGGKHPSPDLQALKKPSPYKVKHEIKYMFDSNRLSNVRDHFPGKGVATDHTFVVCREKKKRWIKAHTGRDMRECPSISRNPNQHSSG